MTAKQIVIRLIADKQISQEEALVLLKELYEVKTEYYPYYPYYNTSPNIPSWTTSNPLYKPSMTTTVPEKDIKNASENMFSRGIPVSGTVTYKEANDKNKKTTCSGYIFEGAKFGDKFITKNNTLAIYIGKDGERYNCILANHSTLCFAYESDGTYDDLYTPELFIVSKYCKPITRDIEATADHDVDAVVESNPQAKTCLGLLQTQFIKAYMLAWADFNRD